MHYFKMAEKSKWKKKEKKMRQKDVEVKEKIAYKSAFKY